MTALDNITCQLSQEKWHFQEDHNSHNKDDKFHRSLQQKGVQVLFQDRVLYILKERSLKSKKWQNKKWNTLKTILMLFVSIATVKWWYRCLEVFLLTMLHFWEKKKTEDLGQSKDKRMPLQPKPKETNIIIINNNMMIQHVIEPGGEEVEENKLLDIFQAWWVSSEPWAQSANLFDFPGEQRKWNSNPILSTLYWILMHGKCQTHPNSSIYSAMLLRVTFSFRIST